ncbi:MAG: hypothetical protein AB1813_25530 [Verrucomicrobiota bacterium]|jgi:hypothetical protein
MKLVLIGLAVVFVLTGLVAWLCSRIRYCITPRNLQILLFGFPIRQIPLEEIETITKRKPSSMAEHWYNTFKPSHRTLLIRRTRGWCKNLVITPRNRYVFKADLERAIENLRSPSEKSKTERIMIVSD